MTLEISLAEKVADWRRKALANELSDDEMREFIATVRQGRVSAQARSTTSRAKKAPIDVQAMEDELNNL